MRDYKRKPNRFSLQMLYNNKLIVTTNRYGKTQKAQRDFDSSFNEPFHLGFNSYNDKRLIQDEKNNPHQFELKVFENSWEAVELGDSMVELFRLILRDGTENFYQDRYRFSKGNKEKLNNLDLFKPNGGGNYYTLVIVDNRSLLRRSNGSMLDIGYLKTEHDVLVQKEDFDYLTSKEEQRMEYLEKQINQSYVRREVFRHSFSADEYSYNGTDFTPPLPLIWKDFNVNFNSVRGDNVEYAEISEFNSIRNKVAQLKDSRKQILNKLRLSEKHGKNWDTSSSSRELEDINADIHYYSSIHFKGLRSNIKQTLNKDKDKFINRFMYPKSRHNNFNTSSSENEITKTSFAV